jgi:mannose-1-phosphate guanylyltransferase/mannose-6-phosphate isomerase
MPSPAIIPVILSGGSGTRLWPMSTAARPKQFLPLVSDRTMFAETLARTAGQRGFAAPLIVCGPGHVDLAMADLAATGAADAQIIVEPAARNTAPAIALAAHAAGAGDTPILVMPSDHVMTDPAAFLAAIAAALPAVRAGALATFGIEPAGPETGYGYIQRGEASATPGVYTVARFVEKPPLDAAQAMIDAGGHYWNAGIFLMRADAYLAALAASAPAIAAACAAAMAGAATTGACIHPDTAAFLASPSDSIDYAVMERAPNVVVTPVDPGWSDVGSWTALHALAARDAQGNAIHGDVIAIDTNDSLIRAAQGVRVATLGLENLIVIATGTADGTDVLVIPMDRAQDIKQIVDHLNTQ